MGQLFSFEDFAAAGGDRTSKQALIEAQAAARAAEDAAADAAAQERAAYERGMADGRAAAEAAFTAKLGTEAQAFAAALATLDGRLGEALDRVERETLMAMQAVVRALLPRLSADAVRFALDDALQPLTRRADLSLSATVSADAEPLLQAALAEHGLAERCTVAVDAAAAGPRMQVAWTGGRLTVDAAALAGALEAAIQTAIGGDRSDADGRNR